MSEVCNPYPWKAGEEIARATLELHRRGENVAGLTPQQVIQLETHLRLTELKEAGLDDIVVPPRPR